MAEYENRYATASTRTQGAAIDAGLRSYMLTVYNYMAGGVALTGLVAYVLFSQAITLDPALAAKSATGGAYALKRGMYLTQLGATLYASPLKWVVMLAPLAFVLVLSFGINKMSTSVAQLCFWAYAAVMGVSLSSIFMVFTHTSIAQMFFVTAAAFASLSIYGYTTKKDLSGWGSFLFMGLIGIILAGLVNLFLKSSALQFAISAIGVLVFAGLTAYDTQRIKDTYFEVAGNAELAAKAAIMGALSLYLDFINMFMMMLQLFGNRD
ncbi:MAG TPA: Bax inhibitor-1/YccA family protein [Hyphomicrobiaceae bacterium]|nr:Bax inhibitor-1/YccA family protein [Hyphomicrobiaceae bacterium]